MRPRPPASTARIAARTADIGKARRLLGYEPVVGFDQGLEQTVAWFRRTQMTTA